MRRCKETHRDCACCIVSVISHFSALYCCRMSCILLLVSMSLLLSVSATPPLSIDLYGKLQPDISVKLKPISSALLISE